jgi:hypothetical protein
MKQQPISDLSVNLAVDPKSSIPFRGNPQEYLAHFIGRAGNTRPGGMLIGADKIMEEIQNNSRRFRG